MQIRERLTQYNELETLTVFIGHWVLQNSRIISMEEASYRLSEVKWYRFRVFNIE